MNWLVNSSFSHTAPMPAIWLDASTVRLAIVPSAFSVTTTLTGSSSKPGAEPVSAFSGRGSAVGSALDTVPPCTLPSTTFTATFTVPVKPSAADTCAVPSS